MWVVTMKTRIKINRIKLEDIEFFENGMKLDIPKKTVKSFIFCGLNNIDFITSDFYKDGWVGSNYEKV